MNIHPLALAFLDAEAAIDETADGYRKVREARDAWRIAGYPREIVPTAVSMAPPFNVWELASLGITNRLQPMPATVQALLP